MSEQIPDTVEQPGGRQRSTIRFPYGDLADAEQIVTAMYENRGREAETSSVAADMNTTMTSGTFRTRLASAVTFGLLETVRGTGKIRLTPLGERLADPNTRSAARVEAFLTVPLYGMIYREYKGGRLPGDAGIESVMVALGVSPKQVSRARQAMVRSADTAGFYAAGRDRLVEPSIRQPAKIDEDDDAGDQGGDDVGRRNGQERKQERFPIMEHPLIQGLLQVLPAPGETLSAERRKKWMSTLETSLELIYPEPTPNATEQPSAQSSNAPPDSASRP